jgi:hypothetical protein
MATNRYGQPSYQPGYQQNAQNNQQSDGPLDFLEKLFGR